MGMKYIAKCVTQAKEMIGQLKPNLRIYFYIFTTENMLLMSQLRHLLRKCEGGRIATGRNCDVIFSNVKVVRTIGVGNCDLHFVIAKVANAKRLPQLQCCRSQLPSNIETFRPHIFKQRHTFGDPHQF